MWYAIVGTAMILVGLAAVYMLGRGLVIITRPVQNWYFLKFIKPKYPSQTKMDGDDLCGFWFCAFFVFVCAVGVIGLGYLLGKAVMT